MNINSNEIMLINKKNINLRNSAPETPINPVSEPPVTNPEASMRALDLQGRNNIAFQSVQAEIGKKATKKVIPVLMALAVASGITSCTEPEPQQPITITNTVTVKVVESNDSSVSSTVTTTIRKEI